MKRAVLYARVSTKTQRKDGTSLLTQLGAMRIYASKNENNFEVVRELTDDVSGTIPVAERPAGSELYDLMRQKEVDVVILYTIDRAARDEDVLEFGIFKRDCKRAGVELHFVDSGKVVDDAIGGLLEHFKAAGAAEERKKIHERTQRGLMAKARAGRWVGVNYPLGYCKVGKAKETRIDIDLQQATVVRRIFELYLGFGGNKRQSVAGVAVRLMEEAIPTMRGSSTWSESTLRAILRNRAYIGEFKFAGHIAVLPEMAIIPKEWFEMVSERIQKNRDNQIRNCKHEYLLAGGRLLCHCGRVMRGVTLQNGRTYYQCHGNHQPKSLRQCEEKKIRAVDLDTKLWAELLARLTESVLVEGLRARRQQLENELEPRRNRLQSLSEEIERTTTRIRKLMNAFAEAEDETISAEYQLTLKEASRKKDALNTQRRLVEGEIAQASLSLEDEKSIIDTVGEFRKRIENGNKATFAQRHFLVDVLDVRLKMTREETLRRFSVEYNIGAAFSFESVCHSSHAVLEKKGGRRKRTGQTVVNKRVNRQNVGESIAHQVHYE